MNTLYLILGGVAIVAIALGIAVWSARKRGEAETEADYNNKAAQDAKTAGRIVAEHREPEDAARRLDDGSF